MCHPKKNIHYARLCLCPPLHESDNDDEYDHADYDSDCGSMPSLLSRSSDITEDNVDINNNEEYNDMPSHLDWDGKDKDDWDIKDSDDSDEDNEGKQVLLSERNLGGRPRGSTIVSKFEKADKMSALLNNIEPFPITKRRASMKSALSHNAG